ncbi:MAG TPA: DUF427 domain-containing protein [Microthrixaceae bacterium]|jgi:uncharacterized protein (DUF427 family)|nr:DUF427 domain-containing protein [Microthrixaceae bacterium]
MSTNQRRPVDPDPVGPNQESVWDYPRPPRLELVSRHLVVRYGTTVIADTTRAHRVVETSHPPTYYLPPDDCDVAFLAPAAGASYCEWKGHAVYFDVTVGDDTLPRVAWSYPDPTRAAACLRRPR